MFALLRRRWPLVAAVWAVGLGGLLAVGHLLGPGPSVSGRLDVDTGRPEAPPESTTTSADEGDAVSTETAGGGVTGEQPPPPPTASGPPDGPAVPAPDEPAVPDPSTTTVATAPPTTQPPTTSSSTTTSTEPEPEPPSTLPSTTVPQAEQVGWVPIRGPPAGPARSLGSKEDVPDGALMSPVPEHHPIDRVPASSPSGHRATTTIWFPTQERVVPRGGRGWRRRGPDKGSIQCQPHDRPEA